MNAAVAITSRQTKYAKAVLGALQKLSHATNLELLREVQRSYPEVSATTIHRVTVRLKQREVIGCAPKSASGAERYDSNPEPHHHFMCLKCSRICDVIETEKASFVLKQLKELTKECAFAGSLTMQGTCIRCVKKVKYNY